MPNITISSLSPDTIQRLERRAAKNGRSMEAEILAILENAVMAGREPGLGTALAEIGRTLVMEVRGHSEGWLPPESWKRIKRHENQQAES